MSDYDKRANPLRLPERDPNSSKPGNTDLTKAARHQQVKPLKLPERNKHSGQGGGNDYEKAERHEAIKPMLPKHPKQPAGSEEYNL
jgi:hypothetical protein